MASTPDFERIFRSSPNAYMVVDRALRYVAANEAYTTVTGRSLGELLGRTVFELFPHDPSNPDNESVRRLRASLERTFETGEPDTLALLPYRVPTAPASSNEVGYWSATHTPLFDDSGEVAWVLQHTVNVTELHRLQQLAQGSGRTGSGAQTEASVLHRARAVSERNVRLDAERLQLKRLFEQAPGFMCFLEGPAHVFALANEAYLRLIGRKDILDRPIRAVLPELEGQGYFELLDRVYETATPFVGQGSAVFLRRTEDERPEERFVNFVYQPILAADGRVIGIFVEGQDITEQKALEVERERLLAREREARQQAEEASRLKDEFLGTVSHELRTPLTSILGWIQYLRRGRVPTEKQGRVLETLERNARSQAQLIEDLLDVARIESGQLRLDVAEVDLEEVVRQVIESQSPAAQGRGLTLEVHGAGPAVVLGDSHRLQQIVWNLVSNAVKFTQEGGRVTVSLRPDGERLEVEVADTGQGIRSEFLPFVFERFRQADPGSKRRHGGLGLGLSIVRHLVEMHGGTVSAASDGEDKGAVFTVQLPLGRQG